MARLIDADKAIFELGIEDWEIDCKHFIDEQPTVDAVEVVHGRWSMVKVGETIALAKCSACGRKMNPSQYGYAYCGLCGAKMDGGDKE